MAKEERVSVEIPRASGKDDPNFFVGVNGVSYLLPRGKKSLVPKPVAEEVERAFRAQENLDSLVDKLVEAAQGNK